MKQFFFAVIAAGCNAAGNSSFYIKESADNIVSTVVIEHTLDVIYANNVLDAELLPIVQVAADRWIEASCLNIRVDGGGVKWSYADVILTPEGKEADGELGPDHVNPTYAHLLPNLRDPQQVATHEMGHRLHMGHIEASELMNDRNVVNREQGLRFNHIGEVSLAAVCSVNDCGCFNPESGPESDPSLIEVRQCQTITSAGVSSWGPCP